jgi:two-component system, OmpR family, alkaline phosphatase synthesis response regulator PhoP
MQTDSFKILLVDDEMDVLEFLGYNLRKEGFEVYTAQNGSEALKLAADIKPHVIFLDVMMPGMDGIETCQELRKNSDLKNSIILFLTARGEDYSQIAGFEAGADDYVNKPIRPKVLVSRVKALLRRSKDTFALVDEETDDLIIDRERYLVIKDGKEIILPKKEFELLSLLYSKPDRVFNRDEIFSKVWGDDIIVGNRTIDVHIRKIREKLGIDNIRTIKGIGYKFEAR